MYLSMKKIFIVFMPLPGLSEPTANRNIDVDEILEVYVWVYLSLCMSLGGHH